MASKAVKNAFKAWEHEKSIGIGAKARERQKRGVVTASRTKAIQKAFKPKGELWQPVQNVKRKIRKERT